MKRSLPDIKPYSEITALKRDLASDTDLEFNVDAVAPLVGMNSTFVRKVCGKKATLDMLDVYNLLDQDQFSETFVPRSQIPDFLVQQAQIKQASKNLTFEDNFYLHNGDAIDFVNSLPSESVQCIVTSTPYWGLRIYKDPHFSSWADKAECPFGHEQTPEQFVRHSAEILHALSRVLKPNGSIWWNLMDTFNTRTQIRGNAVEALRAMQGKDSKSWGDHECRRYSAGHAFLKDGEQCLIPHRIAERASRMGLYVKTIITWAKTGTLPEPQNSRVSRNLEYILHLSKTRTPQFDKSVYRSLPVTLGGRNNGWETDKLSDVWTLPTSSGRDGHGAQFPIALPARCIALTTSENDVVMDPFVGAGNAGVAALSLGRRFIGIDVSREYLKTAKEKIKQAAEKTPQINGKRTAERLSQGTLL